MAASLERSLNTAVLFAVDPLGPPAIWVFGAVRSRGAGGITGVGGATTGQAPAVGGAVWSVVKNAWMQCVVASTGNVQRLPAGVGQFRQPDERVAVRGQHDPVGEGLDEGVALRPAVDRDVGVPSELVTRPCP